MTPGANLSMVKRLVRDVKHHGNRQLPVIKIGHGYWHIRWSATDEPVALLQRVMFRSHAIWSLKTNCVTNVPKKAESRGDSRYIGRFPSPRCSHGGVFDSRISILEVEHSDTQTARVPDGPIEHLQKTTQFSHLWPHSESKALSFGDGIGYIICTGLLHFDGVSWTSSTAMRDNVTLHFIHDGPASTAFPLPFALSAPYKHKHQLHSLHLIIIDFVQFSCHLPNNEMSEYPDLSSLRDIRIDTSFTRPQSGGRDFLTEPVPRDRYSRHSGQTPPRVRDVTWISTSQSQIPSTHTHTPQTPRHMPPIGFQQVRAPTPVLRKSAQTTVSESDIEAEYMTVSVDDRDECNYKGHGYGFSEVVAMPTNAKSEKKNFVGGFVSGLRRLPKVMSKSRLRDHIKPERQGTSGTAASTFETGRTMLPRNTGPYTPGVPKTNSDDIPTVERLETPPRASSASPARLANPVDGEASFGDGRRERLMLSAVHEHSYEHSLHPSLHVPRPHSRSHNISASSRPFEPEGEFPNAMSTPILAEASIRVSSPILAEPRPSADFAKMESPIRPPPAESVASQLARVRRFFRDLNGLPWIASRDISDVYVPGQSAIRRRYSRPRDSKSWYTPRNNRTLDLLAGPSTVGLLPPQQPTPVHAQMPGSAPFILGSSANLLFSQPPHGGGGGSRSPSHEGPPSTDSHGSQAQVLAPAYVAQPLFVYPSGLPQPGGSGEAQYPRPVYMLATSQPHFMSPNDGAGPRLFVPQPSGLRTPTFERPQRNITALNAAIRMTSFVRSLLKKYCGKVLTVLLNWLPCCLVEILTARMNEANDVPVSQHSLRCDPSYQTGNAYGVAKLRGVEFVYHGVRCGAGRREPTCGGTTFYAGRFSSPPARRVHSRGSSQGWTDKRTRSRRAGSTRNQIGI
ncbi:hypothetical protein BS17DRAFT_811614 [Gyrodon lividus]|nr:hypothetical protein BS17DRAFT_811614 [Gyrodon lividus]